MWNKAFLKKEAQTGYRKLTFRKQNSKEYTFKKKEIFPNQGLEHKTEWWAKKIGKHLRWIKRCSYKIMIINNI